MLDRRLFLKNCLLSVTAFIGGGYPDLDSVVESLAGPVYQLPEITGPDAIREVQYCCHGDKVFHKIVAERADESKVLTLYPHPGWLHTFIADSNCAMFIPSGDIVRFKSEGEPFVSVVTDNFVYLPNQQTFRLR